MTTKCKFDKIQCTRHKRGNSKPRRNKADKGWRKNNTD